MTSEPCRPADFLEIRVHDLSCTPGLTAACAGYESGQWRSSQLAWHAIEWLPEFALTERERAGVAAHNAVRMIARASQVVYETDRPEGRGELGELLLHILLRQVFGTVPAICKLYFKDSANDIIKGFDAVHVVVNNNSLELWLGEAKFYKKISDAITAVVKEIQAHTQRNYLRSEFAAITKKIDSSFPYAERLRKLIDPTTSLDTIFDQMCIPILLTYESPVIAQYTSVTNEFVSAFRQEVVQHLVTFSSKNLPASIHIHLFLMPLGTKDSLIDEFDRRLNACRELNP